MPINFKDDNYENNRLSIKTLRSYEKYANVTDDEADAILDDALALARMILEIID